MEAFKGTRGSRNQLLHKHRGKLLFATINWQWHQGSQDALVTDTTAGGVVAQGSNLLWEQVKFSVCHAVTHTQTTVTENVILKNFSFTAFLFEFSFTISVVTFLGSVLVNLSAVHQHYMQHYLQEDISL